MSQTALSGNDTVMINNTILSDFADGDVAVLTFPNEIANVVTGKNGNAIYGLNETGKQCELELRVIRGGRDDQFLNNLLVQQQQNFAGFVLMIGQFVKKLGDSQGNITNDTYILSGGIFTHQVDVKTNVTGEAQQSVAVYKMKFSNAPRAIT